MFRVRSNAAQVMALADKLIIVGEWTVFQFIEVASDRMHGFSAIRADHLQHRRSPSGKGAGPLPARRPSSQPGVDLRHDPCRAGCSGVARDVAAFVRAILPPVPQGRGRRSELLPADPAGGMGVLRLVARRVLLEMAIGAQQLEMFRVRLNRRPSDRGKKRTPIVLRLRGRIDVVELQCARATVYPHR